jgi:hypothetical protein
MSFLNCTVNFSGRFDCCLAFLKKANPLLAQFCFFSLSLIICSGCVYRPWTDWSTLSYAMPAGSKYATDVEEPVQVALADREAKALRGRLFMPRAVELNDELPKPDLEARAEVRRELSSWTGRNRAFVERSIERAQEHLPMITEIFQEEGVPRELIAVALVESGFRPDARSYAGALGMWQFMKATGKTYGLEGSWLSDDRKDVFKSTVAAARHLRDLYAVYGDWQLSLAAYNAGSGRVDRAIRSGGVRDFWELSKKRLLPMQTRLYVPKILAAAMILKDPAKHGFDYEAVING